MPDIGALLSPASVAVVGASPDTNILRGRIMHVLGCHPYNGKVYPISRSHEEVMGLKAYHSVSDLPEAVDLAVLIIPSAFVPDTLKECGAMGVKAAQIITSGFAEEVGGEGEEQQRRIREIAEKYDMAVCGPNSEGFANMGLDFCPTFSPAVDDPNTPLLPEFRKDGRIGVVAQSGGMGFAFYDRGRPKQLPFSYVVTTGNEACLEGFQLVEYMLDEDGTDVIVMFIEDIKTPSLFPSVAEKAVRAGKPIIVTKIGHSRAGQRAAASHTAALAGSYAAYNAMFRRYGVIEGRDIEEIVDIAAGFSYWRNRLPKGKRVGIITGSGGAGGWMADTAIAAGLTVPTLDGATREAIDAYLPSYGTSQNPVDGTAQAIRTVGYANLSKMVAASNEVDAIIAISSARNASRYEAEFDAMAKVGRESEKPIFFNSYTMPKPEGFEIIGRAGYPLFTNMRNCAHVVACLADYRAFREQFLKAPEVSTKLNRPSGAADILQSGGDNLTEFQAKLVLKAYGVEIPEEALSVDANSAVDAAALIEGPVALKVQSPDILHKTEAGAVALGLEGADAVREGYETVMARAQAYRDTAQIDGVLVQPMAPAGREIILGINRDEAFGQMLMVGLGGVYVEVMRDVVFAPVPLRADEAHAMLERLQGKALLWGVRGDPPADISALVDLMVTVSRIADDWCDEIAEIDLNPVLVHPEGQGLSVVDALIVKQAGD